MTQFLKRAAGKCLAVAIAASFMVTTAMPVVEAEAGHRKHWKQQQQHHKHYKRKKRSSSSDALAAGIIGFAIGAIIADQASRPRTVYVQPEPVYVPPQPVYRQSLPVYSQPQPVYQEPVVNRYDEPRVIRYEDELAATYEPWTPEWARWCDNRYRSFNPSTGTFRGYDGLDHFCVVK